MRTAEDDWQERARDIRDGKRRGILDVLEERGYVNQIIGTREDLNTLLNWRRVGVYAGIDPTASSMHVGHMVPFMALGWLYIHGYAAHFLLGGATSRLGDPTDRLTQRQTMKSADHKANMASMHMQLKRFGATLERYAERRGYMREWAWTRALVNNNNWHQKLTVVDFLRVMGSGARLGPMLGRDSVKNRLEKGDGMSFAEFGYPLIQAWDWWELFQKGVQIQIGGADQFGNILAGAEAVKYAAKHDQPWKDTMDHSKQLRMKAEVQVTEDPVGFTVPLLTTSTGEKFGKSAGNAVWLDKDMTSTFDLYQFFLRSADADVEKYLRLLTFIPTPEIAEIMETHRQDESKRLAQHRLAKEFVELIHGLGAAEEAESEHRQLFKKTLTLQEVQESLQQAAVSENSTERPADLHPKLNKHAQPQTLENNASTQIRLPRSLVLEQPLSRILWSAGLVASRSEGQRLVNNAGVYIGGIKANGEMQDSLSYTKATDSSWNFISQYIMDEKILILRTGKWRVKIVNIMPDEEFESAGLTCPGWDTIKDGELSTADVEDVKEEQDEKIQSEENESRRGAQAGRNRKYGKQDRYGKVVQAGW